MKNLNSYFRKWRLLLVAMLLLGTASCGGDKVQSEESKKKWREQHTGFNEKELTKLDLSQFKDTITAVAFGHVNSLLWHPDVFDSFIKTINGQNPDYIWVLGDIVYDNSDDEWNKVLKGHNQMKGDRFYTAGNHDICYHYERFDGILENEWEAEERYLDQLGYRYLTMEDEVANYMILNLNDSLARIKEYLDIMKPKMNPDKPSFLLTHQSAWQAVKKERDDPSLWVNISFHPDSLLKELGEFDYLVNGDWANKYFRASKYYLGENHEVICTGNKVAGDELRITVLKYTRDTCESYPIIVPIPEGSDWYK